MSQTPLLIRESGAICTLTLNTPDNFNALSHQMLDALHQAQTEIAQKTHLSVLVVEAQGRAFCAGHDLREMHALPDREAHRALFQRCAEVMAGFTQLPQVSIAQVQGIATAAGCQLVASCDLAVASRASKFAVSGIQLGLFCSTPAVALSRNIGRKQALRMLLTGEFISAEQARQWGLVNEVCEPEALEACAQQLAEQIAAHPCNAIHTGKRLFQQQLEAPLVQAYEMAGEAMADNVMYAEAQAGIDAFVHKRPPPWRPQKHQ